MDAAAKSIPDWKLYLSSQYKAEFSDDTARIIRETVAAVAKRGPDMGDFPTVNTKDLLTSLTGKGGPLRGLELSSYIGGNTGVPPWHESQADLNQMLSLEHMYGLARPSVEFHACLQTAASLVSTTPGFENVTPWHLAIALLSSAATGITWQLQVRNSSIDQAAEFLIAKMEREQPTLYSASRWREQFHLSQNAAETTDTVGMDRNGALSHLDSQWTQFLGSKKWAAPLEEGLARARDFQKWMIQEAPPSGSSSTHSPINALPFRLSEEVIILSLLILITEIARGSRALDKARHPEWAKRVVQSEALERERLKSQLQRAFFRALARENSPDKFRLIPPTLEKTLDHAEALARSISNARVDERHFVAACFAGENAEDLVDALNQEGIRADHLIDVLVTHIREDSTPTAIDNPNGWQTLIHEILAPLSSLQKSLRSAPPDQSPTAAQSSDEQEAPPVLGGKPYFRREASEHELCLNIRPQSKAIAQTFHSASEEGDFVFALYGVWGRGKTKLARAVASRLQNHGHTPIFFSAWKYPSRPEVWVHLYQEIAKRALEGDWRRRMQLSFQVGILRYGWSSLILALVLLLLSRLPGLFGVWLAHGLGVLGILMLVFFGIRAYSAGRSIYQRYLTLPDHADKLGLQAVVGNDLSSLLRLWISPPQVHADGRPQEKFPPDSIDFTRGCGGRRARTSAISLFTITLGLLTWQIWTAAPPKKSERSLVAAAMADIQASTSELATTAKSLESRLGQTSSDLKETLSKLPVGPATPAAGTSPSPTSPPTANPSPSLDIEISIVNTTPTSTNNPAATPADTAGSRVAATESDNWDQKPWERLQTGMGAKITSSLFLVCLAVAGWWFVLMVSKRISQTQKLLLVVDDLDRCEPEQMLAVIESLRMFLDDPSMSGRMQIMMLLDWKILELALKRRCRALRLAPTLVPQFMREQREKWFVVEFTLPPLSKTDLKDAVNLIVDREAHAAARQEIEDIRERQRERQLHRQQAEKASSAGRNVPHQLEKAFSRSPVAASSPTASQEHPSKEDTAEVAPAPSFLSEEEEAEAVRMEELTGTLAPNVTEDVFEDDDTGETTESWLDHITYGDPERDQIKQAFATLNPAEFTPRRIRSLTLRYQLARLLLRHLGIPPNAQHLLACLTRPNESHEGVPEQIREVAKSVL